jgi:hypothetical protein
MNKLFFLLLVLAGCSCQNNTATEVEPEIAQCEPEDETSDLELYDDEDSTSRIAADTTNTYRFRIVVVNSCLAGSSARIRYIPRNTSTESVVDTTLTTRQGAKSFSVTPDRFRIVLLKTVSKRNFYSFYMRTEGKQGKYWIWKRVEVTLPNRPATYKKGKKGQNIGTAIVNDTLRFSCQ